MSRAVQASLGFVLRIDGIRAREDRANADGYERELARPLAGLESLETLRLLVVCLDAIDSSPAGAGVAAALHARDRLAIALEDDLHRAVASVSRPAVDALGTGTGSCRVAEEDALDAPVYHQPPADRHRRIIEPRQSRGFRPPGARC